MINFKTYVKEQLNYELSSTQINQFEEYFNFLIDYNQKVNLTRIVDKEEVYVKHFIDSLLTINLVCFNSKKRLLDMGSGAGFPAIPIKIIYPHLEVLLVDSRNKKVSFLNELIKKLNLTNTKAVHERLENLDYPNYFDIVTARALGNLSLIGKYAYPLVKKGGIIISYKGSNYKEELDQFEKDFKDVYKVKKMDKKELPNNMGKRTNLVIQKL